MTEKPSILSFKPIETKFLVKISKDVFGVIEAYDIKDLWDEMADEYSKPDPDRSPNRLSFKLEEIGVRRVDILHNNNAVVLTIPDHINDKDGVFKFKVMTIVEEHCEYCLERCKNDPEFSSPFVADKRPRVFPGI